MAVLAGPAPDKGRSKIVGIAPFFNMTLFLIPYVEGEGSNESSVK